MYILVLFLALGLLQISKRPIVIRFNKVKNSCTRESKFIWEKHCRTKKLCNLSDIESVKQYWIAPLKRNRPVFLFLKDESNIQLFPYNSQFRNYYEDTKKINDFLSNKRQKELILREDNIRTRFGVIFIIISIIGIIRGIVR